MKIKTKHIDAAREVRLWLGQIVIPTVGILAFLNPERTRQTVNNGANRVRNIFYK